MALVVAEAALLENHTTKVALVAPGSGGELQLRERGVGADMNQSQETSPGRDREQESDRAAALKSGLMAILRTQCDSQCPF